MDNYCFEQTHADSPQLYYDPTNQLDPNHDSSYIESISQRRRSSCCSHCDKGHTLLNPLENQTLSLTPPLDSVYYETDEDQPFSCIYLLNLFLAPDMEAYLKETSISDDVYSLPVHLQRLICEARMEVMVKDENKDNKDAKEDHPALRRLGKVRNYIETVAHHDTAAIISTLGELIHDEDEMLTILE